MVNLRSCVVSATRTIATAWTDSDSCLMHHPKAVLPTQLIRHFLLRFGKKRGKKFWCYWWCYDYQELGEYVTISQWKRLFLGGAKHAWGMLHRIFDSFLFFCPLFTVLLLVCELFWERSDGINSKAVNRLICQSMDKPRMTMAEDGKNTLKVLLLHNDGNLLE